MQSLDAKECVLVPSFAVVTCEGVVVVYLDGSWLEDVGYRWMGG